MSTKTTFKRIALVTVAVLGFGTLSTVTASAASAATVALGTISSNAAVVGQSTTVTVPLTVTGGAASDTFTVSAVLTSAPATSARTLNAGADVAADVDMIDTDNYAATACTISSTSQGSTTLRNTALYTITTAACPTTGAAAQAKFTFTPDVAGAYTFVVFRETETVTAANNGIDGVLQAGETAKYFSVTAVASPAASTTIANVISAPVASYHATGRAKGGWVKVSLKDAAGVATRLSASQQVVVTMSYSTCRKCDNWTISNCNRVWLDRIKL